MAWIRYILWDEDDYDDDDDDDNDDDDDDEACYVLDQYAYLEFFLLC